MDNAQHPRTHSDVSSADGFGSENSDYSSDSSSCASDVVDQTSAQQENARQRRSDGLTAMRLGTAVPCLYKFDGDTGTEKTQPTQYTYATTGRRNDLDDESLKDLIKYSPTDLLGRAWHLLPPALKADHFPPYRQFPKCPHIFDVKMPDTNQVSQFMCAVALETQRRHTSPTKMHLRAALVESVANNRIANSAPPALQGGIMDTDIDPQWDDTDDLSPKSWDGSVDADDLCSLDFSIALSPPAAQGHITLTSLHLLHRFLNRSIEWPQHTVTQSWGARYAMQTVLRCLEKELSIPSADDQWLAAAFCLLLKFALMNGEEDLVLSLMRLCYHNHAVFRRLTCVGIKPFIAAVEACSSGRVRLPVPQDVSKGQTLSMGNSLPPGTTQLRGICVEDAGVDSYAILLTDNGVYRVALTAPFMVVAKNPFYTPDVCHGVLIEGDNVVVVGNSGTQLDVLDRASLQRAEVQHSTASATSSTGTFAAYAGAGRFVNPHFVVGGPRAKVACFRGTPVSGTFNQVSLPLPRSCESLAVQFFLFPENPTQPTVMTLLSATTAERVWLRVTVALNPQQRSMKLTFRHGADATVEIEEPIRAEWALWSATLNSVNGVASWTVYRNASLCDAQRRSGGVVRSDGLVNLTAFSGTFTGSVAKLFLWSESQRQGHLWHSAMQPCDQKRDPSLLCALVMNEGNGCTLHCSCSNLMWRGTQLGWKTPSKAPPFTVEPEKAIAWQPAGSYHIVWNGAELAVIEPTQVTWLSLLDGAVIEQQTLKVESLGACFYSTFSGKFFFGFDGTFEVSVVHANDPPSSYVLGLESTVKGRRCCESIAERVLKSGENGETRVSLTDFAEYTLFKLNSELLAGSRRAEEPNRTCLWIKKTVSMRTVARLLSICDELTTRVESGTGDSFEGLLFCVCGKLLKDQAERMGQHCPDAIVPSLLGTCKFAEESGVNDFPFCADAKQIYGRLHSTVLARCVSHAYQLQLITQSESLKDVLQLLMPENVPALVTSVVEKGLKKPFMTLLNRLKEQCLLEAEDVLNHRSVQFRASEPTLLVVLAVLAQKDSTQWHLVAVALISSLLKGILRRFEAVSAGTDDTNKQEQERTELLQQTALGVVVFPVVHYLLNMDFAPSIAGDVLKVLNDTRLSLQRYVLKVDRPTRRSYRFTETHTVVTPPGLQTAFSATLDLQHAISLQIELSNGGTPEGNGTGTLPVVSFALIDNDCKRVCQSAHEGIVSFNRGGRLSIECNDVAAQVGMSAVIQATAELSMEEGNWMQEMVDTVSHTTVRVISATLNSHLIDEPPLPRDSFFRNGLTPATLEANGIKCGEPADESVQGIRELLLQLASSPPQGELVTFWSESLAQRSFPYLTRIGDLVRACTCAIVWHTLATPTLDSLKETMSSVLDWVKRKTFLLLEVHQQGRGDEVVQRSLFLLKEVMPRSQGESQLADQQPTEEVLTTTTGARVVDSRPSRGGTARHTHHHTAGRDMSTGHRSRADVSYRGAGAETLDFSTGYRHTTGRTAARRDRRNAAAMNIFRNQLLAQTESLPNQLLGFLINPGEELQCITNSLLERTRVAMANTAAFKLQEELCTSRHGDYRLVATQLDSFLQYRLALGQSSRGRHHNSDPEEVSGTVAAASVATAKAGTGAVTDESVPEGFDCHYMEQVVGCGLVRELETQRAVCSFVQAALRSLMRLLYAPSLPLRDAVQMCAVLCHPWDAVDMSIMSRLDVFAFLKTLLIMSVRAIKKSYDEASAGEMSREGRGLLDMAHRCLILPNSLLQVSHEGVQIVEGEVEGLHVEDVDIVCCARNHWKAFSHGSKLDAKSADNDLYVNYGVPCVVSELPDVQYFEVTVDLSVHNGPQVAVGVSSVPILPTEAWKPESCFVFSADGNVWGCATAPISFSEPWNVGDVIGCGVLAPHNSVFFTRNGRFLGVAKESTFTTHIPFVSVKGRGSLLKVIVNFGEEVPFAFNIASLNVSVRTPYLTGAVVADAALITVDYLLTMCFKNLQKDDSDVSATNREAVSSLLEYGSSFLETTTASFVGFLNEHAIGNDGEPENVNCSFRTPLAILTARLFHCVTVAIECLRFDTVTAKTHGSLLNLCTVTLDTARDRWVKVRAANCLSLIGDVTRERGAPEVGDGLEGTVPAETVVQSLVDLARVKAPREAAVPPPPPRWSGNGTLATGKGTFFGSAPMPSKGRHMVGFRIRRRTQQGQGVGAPLGGCYYVGLCHGQPQIMNMGSLIGRNDVYVLQDTDDHDQVAHLLLRRHAIPRNNTRRVYGHEEAVWVELNADAGEITFYREDMILIGLAFAGIQRVDDLYPIVFHFNEDATCEIMAPPEVQEDPTEFWVEHYRRSSAIRSLQQLHLMPCFSGVVSEVVKRSVVLADRSVESALVALAVLGGERSYLFAQHDTFGLVVVQGVADVTRKIVVYLASDDERRLLAVTPDTLKPSFVQTPLFTSGHPEAEVSASLLTTELHRTVHEASVIVPLIKQEQSEREAIEREYARESEQAYAMDLVCLIQEVQDDASRFPSRVDSTSAPHFLPPRGDNIEAERARLSALMVPQSTPSTILSTPPYIVERRYTSKSVFTPSPCIAATSTEGAVIIRGNAVLEPSFTMAISVTSRSLATGELMYIGLTASTTTPLAETSEVAQWEDTWALCSIDSAQANSINCAVEPGMIFSDVNLFTSGDVVIMEVDRLEGSVSFSRSRGGKIVQFGALFEGVPPECQLRPLIVCGGGTVVVFSFSDGVTFPARNTYPVSNFPGFSPDANVCTGCQTQLYPPWYMGERNRVALCEFCFKSWRYAKDIFCVAQSPPSAPVAPHYMTSTRAPAKLSPGEYVEFEENTVLSWCPERSVNAQLEGFDCVSVKDECFAITEPLPAFGNARVDVALGHIVGIAGNPFAGVMPLTPLWRDGDQTGTTFAARGDSLQVSITMLPSNARIMLSLTFGDHAYGAHTSTANIFIGLTSLIESVSSLTRPDLEKEYANSTVWGTWCDSAEKISPEGRVIVLVDTTQRVLIMSSTLQGLHAAPFIVNCGTITAPTDEESNLRLAVFSQETCRVEVEEGLMSYGDSVEPSCCPIAFGLVGEDFNTPRLGPTPSPLSPAGAGTLDDRTLLMDTVHGSDVCSPAVWTFSKHALLFNNQQADDSLFRIDDTLTLLQRGRDITVFCQGLCIAWTTLSEQQARRRHRFFLYLSVRGCTARFVPPLFGRTRLGRVLRTYGPEVCVVECTSDTWEKQVVAVRRRDVRFCALVATSFHPSELAEGTMVAYRVLGIQHPKRGKLISTTGVMASIDDSSDDRAAVWVKLSECFVLKNEGDTPARQPPYPLVLPPSNAVTHTFEVGKNKFRLTSRGSYNGIVFDCKAAEKIELTSISVLSHTTGRQRVDLFFKRGTHRSHERDPKSWTPLFSDFIDLHAEMQFTLTFPPVSIDAGIFALYVNTSHNCGVGFYCEEDGCSGDVGTEMDDDGTLVVYLGRKSGSSTPFGELSTTSRGFCGSLVYRKNRGSAPPLIEIHMPASAPSPKIPKDASDVVQLVSHPRDLALQQVASFQVEVAKMPVRLLRLCTPIVLNGAATGEDGGVAHGLRHCVVTLYCRSASSVHDPATVPGQASLYTEKGQVAVTTPAELCGGSRDGWRCVWRAKVLLEGETTNVDVSDTDLALTKGVHAFAMTAENELGEPVQWASFLTAQRNGFTRQNHLLAVSGFFGEILAEADTPAVMGEKHTMSTGATLNQYNSASYNGIMFDLRSKEDITLEEIECISQTTAERVMVRVFWKEGSMEGAEKSQAQWREVTSQELALTDKEPFSPGPLFLRMKANRVYSIFINTSSSCGVRFYNSSDGRVGDIGDEFENDGILSICVGRKSESSTPFTDLPKEPRAFRGKLMYVTYLSHPSQRMHCAMFSHFKAFIVTRMLVALASFVDCVSGNSAFSYNHLLPLIKVLATSPFPSISNIDGVEEALTLLLKETPESDLKSGVATIPLAHRVLVGETLAIGDIALLTDTTASGAGTLVHVMSLPQQDGTVSVCNSGQTEVYQTQAKRLLPMLKCWTCGQLYASSTVCAHHGTPHKPMHEEDERVMCSLANAIMARDGTQNATAALALAQKQLNTSSAESPCSLSRRAVRTGDVGNGEDCLAEQSTATDAANQITVRQGRIMHKNGLSQTNAVGPHEASSGETGAVYSLCFSVPAAQLLTDGPSLSFIGPFAYVAQLEAWVSLEFHVRVEGVSVDVLCVGDDAPLHSPPGASRVLYACVELCAASDRAPEASSPAVALYLSNQVPATSRRALTLLSSATCATAADALTHSVSFRVLLAHTGTELAAQPIPSGDVDTAVGCASSAAQMSGFDEAATPPVVAPDAGVWRWDDGSVEAELHSPNPTFLSGAFSTSKWPDTRRRFCSFVVHSKGKEKTVFLEAHVVETAKSTRVWDTTVSTTTHTRKPFSVRCGELLTLGFSHEGEFFVCDTDDAIRCRITPDELVPLHKDGTIAVGFVCIDQHMVHARLLSPRRAQHAQLCETPSVLRAEGGMVGSPGEVYAPQWVRFDSSQVTLSKNKMTAFCSGDVGGQVVIGTAVPPVGVSAFVLQIDRRDRSLRAPLGSGHFAGVAVTNFPTLTTHFSEMKKTAHVWAVQDVQDEDSLPGQNPIPPMERDGATTNELYAVGTKLLFVVDRSAGTVSLARGSESPRIIFQGVPSGAVIAPFVRLDHTSSSATLSKFSHSSIYRLQYQPSLLKTVLSQPLTPTLLRRYPLYAVMEQFPLVRLIVDALPLAQASTLRRLWQRQGTHSRFEFRVAAVLRELVEVGVLSRAALQCDEQTCFDLFQEPCVVSAIRQLSVSADAATTVSFPGSCAWTNKDNNEEAGAPRSTEAPYVFELPPAYEVVGRVEGTNMLRVLCLDATKGPAEQTANLVMLDDATRPTVMGWTEGLLPHCSTAHHRCVLPSVSHTCAVAVVFDGWFDTTLEDALNGPLSLRSARVIASHLLCAVEHWHLHGRVHGHIQPANIYVHIEDGEAESCVLWNGHYLLHDHPYASPRLRETGLRTLTDDLWSCSRILFELKELMHADPALMECAKLLEAGKTSISDALLQTSALQDQGDEDADGPALTLRTGGRMRGGSGSYNGIMFDVVAKHASLCITGLAFVPDTNSSSVVSLYVREGGFQGFETHADAWQKVFGREVTLADSIETPVTDFSPIIVPAGGRVGLFLHTTNGSGVLFYSEGEGVQAKMGMVEEENNDIGITVGKKSESSQPFTAIQNQKRLLKGSISYRLMTRSSGLRSVLIYNDREGRMEKTPAIPSTEASTQCVDIVGGELPNTKALVLGSDAEGQTHLVLREDGQAGWVKHTDVRPIASCVPPPLLTTFERLLWPSMVEDYRQHRSRLLATGVPDLTTAADTTTTTTVPCASATALPFRQLRLNDRTDAAAESEERALDSTFSTHPKLFNKDGTDWCVSGVLPRRCVVSVWQSDPSAVVEAYLVNLNDPQWRVTLSNPTGAVTPLTCPELFAGKKRLFLQVDADLACFRVSTRRGLHPLTFTAPDGAVGSLCVVVRLVPARPPQQGRQGHSAKPSTSGAGESTPLLGDNVNQNALHAGVSERRARAPCQVFAYVSVQNRADAVTPVGRNTAVVRVPRGATATDTPLKDLSNIECSVGSCTLELQCASPNQGGHNVVHCRRAMQGPPAEQLQVSALSVLHSPLTGAHAMESDRHSAAVPLCPSGCVPLDGSAMPVPSDTCFVCVHAAVRNDSHAVHDFQLFCPHAASVEVRTRSVRQVTASSSCRCSVLSPAVLEGEIHTVTLHVISSRQKPVELMLENPSATNQTLALPFHMEPLLEDPLGFVADVVEQTVVVRIDTRAKKLLVMTSDGAVSDALCGKSCPAKGQLAFELHTAGASVEILDWQCSAATPPSSVEASAIATASTQAGVDAYLSFNITPTVGTLSRHTSHRPSNRLSREKQGSPTARQMEVLIVSYARLLLEKTLIAQDAARQVEQSSLLYSLSYTSLRTSARIAAILDSEHRHNSFELLSQACRYLSLPTVLQKVTGVETAINVVCHALETDHVKVILTGAFVESLTALLLRTSTSYSRRIRHTALRCAQKLLSNDVYPLPSHELLRAHLGPLIAMMAALCKHKKHTSAVVQIGVTLIADLTIRYQKLRPTLRPPGHETCIPYEVVICARALINAVTHDPPLPLPAAFVQDLREPHRIMCETHTKPPKGGLTACYAVFTEHHRKACGEKIMIVKLNGTRQGMVAVGWDLEDPSVNPRTLCEEDEQPLPSCGYCIDALLGNVYVCLARRRETKPLKKTAKAGDVVVVRCSYQEQLIEVSLLRGGHLEQSTSFALTGDEIALPFFYAQNAADAQVDSKYLGIEKLYLDIPQICTDFVNDASTERDVLPQSLDFYAELNMFCQNALEAPVVSELLSRHAAAMDADSAADTEQGPCVLSHDVAGYPLLTQFLEVGAYAKEVPLSPLTPYLFRLQLFDAVMRAFSPLINLKRQSELFDMFGVLKNVCSRQTEEAIQNSVMQPFHHRAGRKVHVTIHSMQAQPSASLGPFQTLVRSIFGQLYVQLHRTPIDTFFDSPMFAVKLAGFGSSDAGGPYRDVLTQLATEVMTPHPSGSFQMNPLFMQCGKGGASAIMPNVDMLSSGQVPLMLEFFGKLLASFFLTSDVFPVELPPLFWKLLLNQDTSVKDLLNLDADIMSLLSPVELMQRSAEELEERFPGITSEWLSIVQQHAHLFLDEALPPETLEGAQLLSERMARSELDRFAESIECIQCGFSQVLPLYTLQAFRWQRVEVLICGTKKLSFEAFKKECEVQLPAGEAEMFFSVLESMTDEDRTSLLRFTTGQSRLPLKTVIKVQHGGMKNSLPTSSTCFFTLRLPLYTSAEIMKERILYAARQCKAIDADGQARENLILDG